MLYFNSCEFLPDNRNPVNCQNELKCNFPLQAFSLFMYMLFAQSLFWSGTYTRLVKKETMPIKEVIKQENFV